MTVFLWLAWGKWRRPAKRKGDVIVSLTSYPPRFGMLSLTLKRLLMQSYSNYRLTLWIADGEYELLPRNVLALTRSGLEIMTCRDLRVYTKALPAMRQFPDCVIVSADDDVCYGRKWLEDLVSEYRPGKKEVLCHRLHGIRLREDGTPLPYLEWDWDSPSLEPHPLNFATGVFGVLYPPHLFPEEAFDEEQMFSRCPTADDIWYYWMTRRSGAIVRKVRSSGKPKEWRGSQTVSLSRVNVEGGENDRIIKNMIAGFGFPA